MATTRWFRPLPALAALGLMSCLFFAPGAHADIIFIKGPQTCKVSGLDSSPATAVGGVHCGPSNAPFSLTGILNGTIALYVGNSQTPSWNIINDTGAAVTTLSLYYSGALASNAFIDMQLSGSGATIFTSCTATTAAGVVTSDSHCGSPDKTGNNPALPLLLVWSGGTGLAPGQVFNLGTASFAHAGADAGCISGTANCQPIPPPPPPVPEPATLVQLATGLLGLASVARRRFLR